MNTFIALLRGINVSGQKKIPMAELRELLEKKGFKDVKTYIQSGNVIFNFSETNKDSLALKIHEAIKAHFRFEVPVLVLFPTELKQIFNDCPFPKEKKEHSYFTFLFTGPDKKLVDKLTAISYPNEEFIITNNCIYFYCAVGYGKAKCSNNFFENKLKTTSTARNYKTVVKLLSLTSQIN
ncbi:DUF1697 domain-containing protein [Seonamhaeicola sp. NFXS20]|uniref:DUF1697 domain-containing protein n=1 Tax=Seonamhaeicola sp. NFXS20 TaxID=2816959 RepID=UPI003B8B694F